MSGNRTVPDPLELYREAVLKHTIDPVGFRQEIGATHVNEQYNPLCGDRVELRFRVRDGRIEAAAFDGESCAICMASASLLCAEAAGRAIGEFHAEHAWLQAALKGEAASGHYLALEPLLGVQRYPARIKCALLPWTAAQKALANAARPEADPGAHP